MLGNLAAALSEQPRPGASRKLSGKEEALLVATSCFKPARGLRPLDAGVVGGEAPARVPLVPNHASWLNMVEIEIGVLRSQCLDPPAVSKEALSDTSNVSGLFTAKKARVKMGRAQPQPAFHP